MTFTQIAFYLFAGVLIFAATMVVTVRNPVKAALVQRADLWPGVNILPSALGKTIKVKRPHKFFRANGPLPAEVELLAVEQARVELER